MAPATVLLAGLLLPFLGLLAPLPAQDARAELVAADQRASQLISDSGLSSALRSILHPTGFLLWPGAPVIAGVQHRERFLQLRPRGDSLRLTWQPLGVEVARDSTLGVTWGVAVNTSRVAAAAPRLGRYISAWRRDSKKWSIAALALIGIEPPSSPAQFAGLPLTRDTARPAGPTAPFIAADLALARLARDSGAATAFRRWAASDALTFGGGSLLVRGPDAIAQAVAGPQRWRWHPVAAGASANGDLGWTVGEAVIEGGEGDVSYSKYLTIWSRSGNQVVRFLLDGGNARPDTP